MARPRRRARSRWAGREPASSWFTTLTTVRSPDRSRTHVVSACLTARGSPSMQYPSLSPGSQMSTRSRSTVRPVCTRLVTPGPVAASVARHEWSRSGAHSLIRPKSARVRQTSSAGESIRATSVVCKPGVLVLRACVVVSPGRRGGRPGESRWAPSWTQCDRSDFPRQTTGIIQCVLGKRAPASISPPDLSNSGHSRLRGTVS